MGGPPVEGKSSERPTRSVREDLRDLTHQRLVTAAETVFVRDGYARGTVGNITKEANVNRATFYLHFSDKSEVLLEVLQVNLADAGPYLRDVGTALVSGDRTNLRSALGRTFEWYEKHGALLRPLREASAIERSIGQRTESEFGRLADEMAAYLARIPSADRAGVHLRIKLSIMQLDQIAFQYVVEKLHSVELSVLLEALTDIWMAALPRVTS